MESVNIIISPSSYQHFTIFIIQLLEGNKALYKPCASFQGDFTELSVRFLCNGGEGHEGEFVYIRDDREKNEYFGLCEVQVFAMDGKRDVRVNVILFIVPVDNSTCGRPEEPMGSIVNISEGTASYECEPGYLLKGDKDITCNHGEWFGQLPLCQG